VSRRRQHWYRLPMPLAVLAVMVMPWRAVRTIRELDGDVDLLILTLAHVLERRGETPA
jgi:hypothetical protein